MPQGIYNLIENVTILFHFGFHLKKEFSIVARRMQSPKLCRPLRSPPMAQQPPSRSCNARPYAHDYW